MQRKATFGLILVWIAVFRCAFPGSAQTIVSLKESGKGDYQLEGRFSVPASSQAVWGVLADYDGIGKFVDSVENSRVRERKTPWLLVEQTFHKRILFFKKHCHLTLKIEERPYEKILFEDVSCDCFDRYAGSWEIQGSKKGTEVLYRLNVSANFSVPSFLTKTTLQRSVSDLLEQVSAEIVKRTASGR